MLYQCWIPVLSACPVSLPSVNGACNMVTRRALSALDTNASVCCFAAFCERCMWHGNTACFECWIPMLSACHFIAFCEWYMGTWWHSKLYHKPLLYHCVPVVHQCWVPPFCILMHASILSKLVTNTTFLSGYIPVFYHILCCRVFLLEVYKNSIISNESGWFYKENQGSGWE